MLVQPQVQADPSVGIMLDNMISEWGGVPYPQLSVMLVHMRFLYLVHQTHHWTAKGDSYYGDHLLFERLYNAVVAEVDGLAEKAVGLGMIENVNLPLQMSQLLKLTQGYGMSSTIPQPSELAKRSLMAEQSFLRVLDMISCQLKQAGLMTRGLDNYIAGVQDTHEGHVYLLKQRCL